MITIAMAPPATGMTYGVQTQRTTRTERFVRSSAGVCCIVEHRRAGVTALRLISAFFATQAQALDDMHCGETQHAEKIAALSRPYSTKGPKP